MYRTPRKSPFTLRPAACPRDPDKRCIVPGSHGQAAGRRVKGRRVKGRRVKGRRVKERDGLIGRAIIKNAGRLLITFLLYSTFASSHASNALPKKSPISNIPSESAFESARTFGVRGDGKTDDTAALQKAMDSGRLIVLPKGTYRITSTLMMRTDNTVLLGHGPSATIIRYEGTGPAIESNPSSSKTLYWCRLSELRIEAINKDQTGALVDWSSMQFGTLQDLWIKGNGGSSIGISLSAIPQQTEATYNIISHSYIGSVKVGIQFGYGANSNTVETSRIQPLPGGVGILMKGQMSNNRIINTGFEYPGNVSGGILMNGDVHNTLIQGNRFESLAYGWKVNGNSNTNTVALGNYYDSIKADATWVNQGARTQNFDQEPAK